jgi:uncharacterized Zn-binding protein involved in type VI secretion
MPAAARLGDPISCGDTVGQGSGNVFINGLPATRTMSDLTVGHCYAPTMIVSSSPTVQTNDKEIALVGDAIVPHTCKKSTHGGTISNGSPDVIFGQMSGTPASQITMSAEDAQDAVEDPANVAARQPTVDAYEAAVHDADDEGAPTPEGEEVPLSTKGQGYVAAAVKDNNVRTNPSQPIDITTPPTIELNDNPANGPTNPATIPAKTGVQTSGYTYDDIDAVSGTFPGSFQLSPNFTLSALTTGCAVSNYAVRAQTVAGVAYTTKDVVKNLRDLCYNILEPLKSTYPSFSVNSGFRHTINGKSQHERGQAVDIAFPGLATDATAAFARAQEIAGSTLPFDQFIFEQNRTIWFHLSYSKTSQRRDVRTKPKGVDTPRPGLVKVS